LSRANSLVWLLHIASTWKIWYHKFSTPKRVIQWNINIWSNCTNIRPMQITGQRYPLGGMYSCSICSTSFNQIPCDEISVSLIMEYNKSSFPILFIYTHTLTHTHIYHIAQLQKISQMLLLHWRQQHNKIKCRMMEKPESNWNRQLLAAPMHHNFHSVRTMF
jgi:hypothetical protein